MWEQQLHTSSDEAKIDKNKPLVSRITVEQGKVGEYLAYIWILDCTLRSLTTGLVRMFLHSEKRIGHKDCICLFGKCQKIPPILQRHQWIFLFHIHSLSAVSQIVSCCFRFLQRDWIYVSILITAVLLYVIALTHAHHPDGPQEQANIQENALAKECMHAPFKLHDYLKTKSQKLWKRKKLWRQCCSCNSSPHTYFILEAHLVLLCA